MEGGWNPKRLVVLEFESIEKDREWYESPEYREARQARDSAAIAKTVIAQVV